MEIAGIVIIGLVLLIIASACLLLGVKIAQIQERSFWKALGASILCNLVCPFIIYPFGLIPGIGEILGSLIALAAGAGIIRSIFKTTFGKALLAEILASILFGLIGTVGWFLLRSFYL